MKDFNTDNLTPEKWAEYVGKIPYHEIVIIKDGREIKCIPIEEARCKKVKKLNIDEIVAITQDILIKYPETKSDVKGEISFGVHWVAAQRENHYNELNLIMKLFAYIFSRLTQEKIHNQSENAHLLVNLIYDTPREIEEIIKNLPEGISAYNLEYILNAVKDNETFVKNNNSCLQTLKAKAVAEYKALGDNEAAIRVDKIDLSSS